MGITYTNANWKFNAEHWAMVLRAQPPEDLIAAEELSGLTPNGWRHWLDGKTHGSYQHPGMLNFLAVCNMLDLDPRDFFTLE